MRTRRCVRRWMFLSLFASWACASLATTIFPPGPWDPGIGEPRPWTEVEALLREVESGRGMAFAEHGGRLLLSDNQRVARIYSDKWAFLGSYAREGNRLSIRFDAISADLSALDADELARYRTGAAQYRKHAAARSATVEVGMSADPVEPRIITTEQFLLVSLPDGDVLVDDDEALRHRLRSWKAGEELELHTWWSGSDVLRQRFSESGWMRFPDPLNAGLPEEMTRLLTPGDIRVRLAEVLDGEESIAWDGQYGSVRVRLDAGEDQGVFSDMRFWGLPPDDSIQLCVVESHADHAVALFGVTRFAPGDPVMLPRSGAMLTSREPESGPQESATPPAVVASGRVISVVPETDDPTYRQDWAIFATVTLDAGRDSGFRIGDAVFHQGYISHEFLGAQGAEGRVLAVDDSTTTLLLRVRRPQLTDTVSLPGVGLEMGTAAWLAEKMQAAAVGGKGTRASDN